MRAVKCPHASSRAAFISSPRYLGLGVSGLFDASPERIASEN